MSKSIGCFILIIMLLLVIFVVVPRVRMYQTSTHGSATPTTSRLRFAVVTNGQATDPFWSATEHGIDQAATDMGVSVTSHTTYTFSVPAMSQLIDAAVATKPNGLVVSIPDCTGLTPAIKRAQLVGIPVISMNSGNDCASKLGLLNYVGQSTYQAGLLGGQKLVAAGAKHVLCVNQEMGNPDFDDRCRGIKDALTQAGGKSEVLAVDLNDPTISQQIQTKLTQDTSIDAVMALSPTIASLVIPILQPPNRLSHIMLATFDLSSDILQAIKQGTMLFAIDRKPNLQGYEPIILLTRYKKHVNVAVAPITATDLSFVTQDNVADTLPYKV